MIFQTFRKYLFPRDKCVCIRIVLPQNLPFLSMKRFVKASNMPLNFNEESATLKWIYKLFKTLFKTPIFIFTKNFLKKYCCRKLKTSSYKRYHSVHPLFFCWGVKSGGVGVEPPTRFSKSKGRVDRISIFRGGLLGKRGVIFFRGLQFIHKR